MLTLSLCLWGYHVSPELLKFREWLTAWAVKAARLKDANAKKRLDDALNKKGDWEVALEKQNERSRRSNRARGKFYKYDLPRKMETQKARRANRSVEQKAADNAKEAERKRTKRKAAASQQLSSYAPRPGLRMSPRRSEPPRPERHLFISRFASAALNPQPPAPRANVYIPCIYLQVLVLLPSPMEFSPAV
jgi:hypothetical protein